MVFQYVSEGICLAEKLHSQVYYLHRNKDDWLNGSNMACKYGQIIISVFWQPPAGDWVKLNYDGVRKGNPRCSGASGVICNHLEGWLVRFYVRLGACSAIVAELQGLIHRLTCAWEHGCRQVEVNVDSRLLSPNIRSAESWVTSNH